MQENVLLALYETAKRDEHFFIEQHQKRIAFFSGLIVAIVGGIIVGTSQAEGPAAHFLLLLLPLLLIITGRYAGSATGTIYRRFLETVTVVAKLEEDLGMTTERVGSAWTSKEPYTNRRHLNDRIDHTSSEAFVAAKMNNGYHLIGLELFSNVRKVAWGAFVLLCLKTIHVLLLECGVYPFPRICCLFEACS